MAYPKNNKKYDKTKPYVRNDQDTVETLKHNATVALDALIDGLNAGHTERFKKYLKTVASLHTYSWSNMLWLSIQNPNITRVASYDRWQKLGRQVRKGESGMYVQVPFFGKKDKEGTETPPPGLNVTKDNDKGAPVFYATKKGVFDISQTDPIEGKEQGEFQWWVALGNNDNGFYNMSADVAKELGLTYREEEITQANGYATGKEIVIKDSLPTVNKVKTTFHELAHHMHGHLEEKTEDRKLRELQAEATAFIVATHFGFDTSDITFDYLLNWGATPETLKGTFPKIVKAAQKIIAAYDKVSGNAGQADEA